MFWGLVVGFLLVWFCWVFFDGEIIYFFYQTKEFIDYSKLFCSGTEIYQNSRAKTFPYGGMMFIL